MPPTLPWEPLSREARSASPPLFPLGFLERQHLAADRGHAGVAVSPGLGRKEAVPLFSTPPVRFGSLNLLTPSFSFSRWKTTGHVPSVIVPPIMHPHQHQILTLGSPRHKTDTYSHKELLLDHEELHGCHAAETLVVGQEEEHPSPAGRRGERKHCGALNILTSIPTRSTLSSNDKC